jgi:hypothetical protein
MWDGFGRASLVRAHRGFFGSGVRRVMKAIVQSSDERGKGDSYAGGRG